MAGKTQERKAALRGRLIEAARAQIEEGGIGSLKARGLAAEAGCAVGAIYNVFPDMHALVLAVNGGTFERLGEAVAAALAHVDGQPAVARLIAMAEAYLDFAAENAALWRTLFDVPMSVEGPVPDWYLAKLEELLSNIAGPVGEMFPDLDDHGRRLLSRTLFSSVHGIVLLGLEQRISGVPRDRVAEMIRDLLTRIGPPKKI